jgi:hypothetical protein
LDNLYVELFVKPTPPRLVSASAVRALQPIGASRTIWEYLKSSDHRHLVVIGAPGMGYARRSKSLEVLIPILYLKGING